MSLQCSRNFSKLVGLLSSRRGTPLVVIVVDGQCVLTHVRVVLPEQPFALKHHFKVSDMTLHLNNLTCMARYFMAMNVCGDLRERIVTKEARGKLAVSSCKFLTMEWLLVLPYECELLQVGIKNLLGVKLSVVYGKLGLVLEVAKKEWQDII